MSQYFLWWYGEGIVVAWRGAATVIYSISQFFSLPTLVRTWLSPWKNDTSLIHSSDLIQIIQFNLVSRAVGFIVRSMVIVLALLTLALVTIVLTFGLIFWFVVPFSFVVLPAIAIIIIQ